MCVGYCDMQALLRFRDPIAYTCGVYGWNYDVYEVEGYTICTGYRGMPGRNPRNLSEYEKKAAAILNNYALGYDEQKKKVEKLLIKFLKQA